MQFRWIAMSLTLLCACAAADQPQGQASHAQAALDDSAREQLRARLEPSRLHLGPLESVAEASEFEQGAALSGLVGVAGQSFDSQMAGTLWKATSERYRASFDTLSGRFDLEGGADYQRGLAHAPDDLFHERARALLSGLAGDVPGHTFELKHLGATTRVLGSEVTQSDARIGSKVFVLRRLGGLRVAGNRLVASFATDGTLVDARGLWPHIDVAHSQLSAQLSAAEASERALDLLLEHGVEPQRSEPIVLESFYQLEPGPEGMVARLRAAALVIAYNHEQQPGRRERHEFDL
jgi:hypothetical protein